MKQLFSYFGSIAGYYLLGKLCLLLAIPPGYSSPIWIPIGFACASIFVIGARTAIIGTFIGAFLLNVQQGLPLFETNPIKVLLLALAVATGSALCIWQTAYFIKKFARFSGNESEPLQSEKQVLCLLFFSSFFSSLISSITGNLALLAARMVDIDFIFLNWSHWWVGDSIGIILITPIGLMWSRYDGPQPLKKLFFYSAPALIVLGCLTISFSITGRNEAQSFEDSFHRNSDRLLHEIEEATRMDLELFTALVGFYQASDFVEEYEFHDFLKAIISNHRNIEQVVWIPSPHSPRYKQFYSHSLEGDRFAPLFIKDKISRQKKDSTEPSLAPQMQDKQILIFPVSKKGQLLGQIIGILDMERAITVATENSDLKNVEITFRDDTTQKSSYWRNNSFSNVERKFKNGLVSHHYEFPVLSHKWSLEVSTTRTELYKGLPSATTLNLFFGLVFSFFVSALQLTLYLRSKNAENTSA